MRLMQILSVEPILAKNNYAKCIAMYCDDQTVKQALCVDSNVRIGELWYDKGETNYGWAQLVFKSADLDLINDEHTKHMITFADPSHTAYGAVIGKQDVLIQFVEGGDIYCLPHKTIAFNMSGGKNKLNPLETDPVIVYHLTK